MIRAAFITLLTLGLVAAASGCSECLRCDKEQDRVLTQMGPPEETESRQTGHLVTETWYYWEQNRSVVFLWDDRDCSCSTSTYVFEDGKRGDEPALSFHTSGSSFFKP
ncbi:MAG: hypothetical protein R3C71_13770 [Candidatus Krumholzibacteriia bacterium]|nr:hypothetical protein [bacterium]MCB9517084.1 hypothetical protein [Candidatus Latescibacterota bacterium]